MVSVISDSSSAPSARRRFSSRRSPLLSLSSPAKSRRASSRSQRDRRRGGDRERDLRTSRRGEYRSRLTRSSGERERDQDRRRRRSSRPRESARLRSRLASRRSPSSRPSSGWRFTRARGDLERERPRDAPGEATIAPGAGLGRVRRARGCVEGVRRTFGISSLRNRRCLHFREERRGTEYNNGSRSSALTAGAATSLNAELRPAARWRCQRRLFVDFTSPLVRRATISERGQRRRAARRHRERSRTFAQSQRCRFRFGSVEREATRS